MRHSMCMRANTSRARTFGITRLEQYDGDVGVIGEAEIPFLV